ncbi:MAG: glycosyltransferase family 39 protein [Candidatus Eisenbacteria bacterium]|nr:glycosyltransferase family 39 protein [Candidatus Eisenbacteria bacterium]
MISDRMNSDGSGRRRLPIRGGGRIRLPLVLLLLGILWIATRPAYHIEAQQHDPYYRTLPLGIDGRAYHEWGLLISHGDWLARSNGNGTEYDDWISKPDGVLTRAPLYAYFLAFLYRVFGAGFGVVYLAQQLLGLSTAVLLFLIGRRLFSPVVGLVAGSLWLLFGTGMLYEMRVGVESLLALLTAASVYFVIRSQQEDRPADWILAGVIIGLTALTRPNWFPYAILLLPLEILRRGRRRWRTGATNWCLLMTGALLVILPFTLRNLLLGHRLVLISANGGLNFFFGNNNQTKGDFGLTRQYYDLVAQYPPGEVPWMRIALREITAEPLTWIAYTVRKAVLFWKPTEIPNNISEEYARHYSPFLRLPWISYGALSLLAMLGAVTGWRRWRERGGLYLAVAVLWITITMLYVVNRFRLPVAPLLAVLAAAGIAWLVDGVYRRRFRTVAAAVAGLATVACMMLPVRAYDRRTTDGVWARNYAAVLADEGRYEEAVREGERARDLGMAKAADLAILAQSYYNIGDRGRAADAICTAIQANADDPGVQSTAGAFYTRSIEDRELADALKSAALRLSPTRPPAAAGAQR